jgi:hypothetical protein
MVLCIWLRMLNISLINFLDSSWMKASFESKVKRNSFNIIICRLNSFIPANSLNKGMNAHLDSALRRVSKKEEEIILGSEVRWWILWSRLHKQCKEKIVRYLMRKMERMRRKHFGLYSPKTRKNPFTKDKSKLFILQLLNKFDHYFISSFVS